MFLCFSANSPTWSGCVVAAVHPMAVVVGGVVGGVTCGPRVRSLGFGGVSGRRPSCFWLHRSLFRTETRESAQR